ncbi:preprotein translocase subunit SecA [Roseiconus lacunae]|uniref:preprotein translocase subunit SecA n=1 Tax=Roseiconus lacunae TaxID=2605694 RepID=UPI001E4D238D|nr:helicase-related protein [Roseiconus lacunae]MCD0463335.1 preprotein translocase subunit SecA [Roseiconus lacunae]
MFFTQPSLADYRNLIGRPKRGVRVVGKPVSDQLRQIRQRCERLEQLSEPEFSNAAAAMRSRVRNECEATRVPNVVESFALTAEALRRTTGMVYYDCQLIGGLALAGGTVAEIQTGEGKTITTALPAALFGWTGWGIHLATTNEYLSRRDYETLRPVYERLGLSVGLLRSQASSDEKAIAYACDLTFGPGYEFGFDFLRDQRLKRSRHNQRLGDSVRRTLRGDSPYEAAPMQRALFMTIIDEADSILIDEANTPLVLSGTKMSTATASAIFEFADQTALGLSEGVDFEIDSIGRAINLTDKGIGVISETWVQRPAGMAARPFADLVVNALKARNLVRRDQDYVVREGRVLIVDGNTGRIHDERKWSNGLHQAIEVKEGLSVSDENEAQARITRQRFIQLYQRVAGLTGTAAGSEGELREFYNLPVVRISPHRPCLRQSLRTRFFDGFESKANAIVSDIRQRSDLGQPILIGTRTIDESQRLSVQLKKHSIPHVVLNGLQDEDEADIVAQAGRSGSVTIATNMAGRGTDIQPDAASIVAGGLHVIATEINHNQRVDRQLAGRAARQGDPGSCQFFCAADDELIATRSPSLSAQMRRDAGPTGECDRDFSNLVAKLQRQSESDARRLREQMVARDRWSESIRESLS